MTTITHHLSPEIIAAYAAGTLPEAHSILVATHISMCDECRAESEAQDAVGGALLGSMSEVSVGENSFAATMARINGQRPEMPKPIRYDACAPKPLFDYIGGRLEDIRWSSIGMGVKQSVLYKSSTGTARMLYIPAGTAVPDHGHRGLEMTLVLQGAFFDEEARFGRGDVEIADEHVKHTPIADIGDDCICLAVTDAPLRFNALIPRLVQPFLGM